MKKSIKVNDFNLKVLNDMMDKHIPHNSPFKHKTTYSVVVSKRGETFTEESYSFNSLSDAVDKYNDIVNTRNPYYIDMRWYDSFLNDIPLANGEEDWITNVYDIIHLVKGDKVFKTPYNSKLVKNK